ncbi:MAG: peptidase S24 [Rhodospirillales bacterium RIFCSPLOWO2_12_FULL_67_15]|nr:MAG: peptidase S24 [Rhodospirillales bacterium RIFCSPLOWO2_12_FULL_67_15]
MILRLKLPLSFLPLPWLAGSVPAGFPSPAADDAESRLDLNAHLIRRPAATFIVRVAGDSMTGAGVHDGDLAIVDRSIEPRPGHVVVAVLDGELALKRLARRGGRTFLESANPAYPPIEVGADAELRIWGVVTATIHRLEPE